MEYVLNVKKQLNDEFTQLELNGDEVINVVFNIADIREPDKVKSNYTEKFKLPGTRTNRRFFTSLEYGGFTPTSFTPNLKVIAQVLKDNEIMIQGYLQVTEILRDDNNNVQDYEVVIYGEIASVFNDIKGLSINNIDLSEYNHTFNAINIIDSWKNNIIKYGKKIKSFMGDGYVYPMEYRGKKMTNGKEIWEIGDFRPAVYVKTIWDKIFARAGKTYTSNFITGNKFPNLIIPFSNGDNLYLPDEEIVKREFRANRLVDSGYLVTNNSYTAAKTTYVPIVFNNEISDPANVWNGSSRFTPYTTFKGTLAANVNVQMDLRVPNLNTIYVVAADLEKKYEFPIYVRLMNVTTNTLVNEQKFILPIKGGNYFSPISKDIEAGKQNFFYEFNGVFFPGNTYELQIAQEMKAGAFSSKVVNLNGQSISANFSSKVCTNSNVYFTLTNKFVSSQGDQVVMNNVLPDMQMDDFLASINRMFNLYWKPNPNKEGDFIIEPRDDMYKQANSELLDWTYKADRNEIISIQPLEEVNFKQYNFTYTEDTDLYNEKYQADYGTIYGSRTINIINDFKTDINNVEVKFSPTPMSVFNNNKPVPFYVTLEEGVYQPMAPKIRIQYYSWLKYDTYADNPNETWEIWVDGIGYQAGSSEFYPYAGHFDNPFKPTWDINFGVTQKYYYNPITFTTNNLVNNYWLSTLNDITQPENHLLTATGHFTPYDIINFNILNIIQFDYVYYRINKFTYNPLTEIAEFELYKLSDLTFPLSTDASPLTFTAPTPPVPPPGPTPPTPKPPIYPPIPPRPIWNPTGGVTPWKDNTTIRNYGIIDDEWNNLNTVNKGTSVWGSSSVYGGIGKTTSVYERDINNNTFPIGKNVDVIGAYNTVDKNSDTISIRGDYNQIGSARNINVMGSKNYVAAGVSNVNVYGDNNYVTKSNTTYTDGMVTTEGGFYTEPTVVRGGINTVGDPFSKGAPLIRSGINAVSNIGGNKSISLIRGGIDTALYNAKIVPSTFTTINNY